MRNRANVALFIDLENFVYGADGQPVPPVVLMETASQYGGVALARAFGHEDVLNDYSQEIRTASIEAVLCKAKGEGERKKNTTDFYMLDSIYQTAYVHDTIDTYVLVTGDGDYISVVAYLRHRLNKTVIVACYEDSVSQELRAVASEVRFLEPMGPRILNDDEREQLLRFVHRGQQQGKRITITSTAKYCKLPGWSENDLKAELSRLASEGVFRFEIEQLDSRAIRRVYLDDAHPWVREAISGDVART